MSGVTFHYLFKKKVLSPNNLNMDNQMVTHLKLLPLRDCFPPRNEQAHKFSGHICAGSPQKTDDEEDDNQECFESKKTF